MSAKLTSAEINTFLRGVHIARIATVRPDGRPHVAPVWYLWEDGNLYIETGRGAVKANNLRANNHVAVTVDVTQGGMRFLYVIMEGQAELIEDKRLVREIASRIYRRYLGTEALETPTVQQMLDSDILIIKMQPDKFMTMNTQEPSELAPLA